MRSPELLIRLTATLSFALALAANAETPALVENNRAPINVSADRATYENGRGIYEGRVELRQGNLAINATRLVIDEQNRQVDRILAVGAPAALNQANGSVHAEARSIEYFVATGKVILTDKAVIQQQGSEIRGNRIVYDSQKQTVEAEGEKGAEQERVNMTLQPRAKDTPPTDEPQNPSPAPQPSQPPQPPQPESDY